MSKAKNELIVVSKIAYENAWWVSSESDADILYKVTLESCECKAFEYRGGTCKHMEKVALTLAEEFSSRDLTEQLEESIRMTNPEEEFDP